MTRCHCEYVGDLTSKAHRDHHREWERNRPERTEHDTRLELHLWATTRWYEEHKYDQLVAWAHGGPLPELTPGAQAILVGQRTEMRRD